MANSVEGRFPFLDMNLVALADALPPRYKLRALDEKYVLKRAATGLIPPAVIARRKQPYRAPDALSFLGDASPQYVQELLGERAVTEAGVFDAHAVHQLMQKCKARSSAGQFSNSDNMALVGVLSTQLLHHLYVHQRPAGIRTIRLQTDVDRILEPA
jgi:asparagine synthase (glutamine-hydrolysing)